MILGIVAGIAVTPPPPFDPATLFGGGEDGGWYDPSDLTTLFQDTAGTVPVTTDGQPVGYMMDKSGNGHHLIAPANVNRLIYHESSGLRWVEGTGVGLHMRTAGNVVGLKQCVTACRYNAATFPNYDGLIGMFTGGTDGLFFTGDFGGSQTTWFQDTDLTNFRRDGVASIAAPMNVNGVCSVEKAGASVAATAQIILMSDRNTGRYWNGRCYGIIIIDRILTSGELADSEQYMADKSGVSI